MSIDTHERSMTPDQQEMLRATGFVSIVDTGQTITLTQKDMPWLTSGERKVHLAMGTLSTGEKVQMGSAIVGDLVAEIEDASGKANPDITNKQFLTLVLLANGNEPGVEQLSSAENPHTIYSNRIQKKGAGGQRQSNPRHVCTYAMRLQGPSVPTFIRVAVSTEKGNPKVQRTLKR